MQVGDEFKVYQILNDGGHSVDHTGKQVGVFGIYEEDILLELFVDGKYVRHLNYFIGNEIKHVATMRITKIKKQLNEQ